MKTDFEYIVLGLGGIGSAAAYWLARRFGSNVLGLEQFEIGHVRGGSQDHSRIIRLSYHTPGYVELAKLAYQAWASLEQDADEALIIKTGGLDLWPANPAIPMHDYTESLNACHVPYERLDAREIMRRWPQWKLTQDVVGLFQSESGIAPAARCNAAHLCMAQAHGATLIDQRPILNIRPVAGEYEVVTTQGTYRCAKLVLATGAWSNQAYRSFGLQLPLTVTQEQVTYFTPLAPNRFTPERFPIWIWMDEPSFYGFPIYGEQAIKVAQDVGGQEVTGDTRNFEPDEANLQRVMNFMRKFLPSGMGPIAYTKTCLYTLTPDRDFVIDALPGHPHVATAIGAGHAFKFASLIGKLLAEMVSGQPVSADLAPFRFDRPILLEKDPQKHFLM